MSIPNLAALFQLSPQGILTKQNNTPHAEGGGLFGLFNATLEGVLSSEEGAALNLEENPLFELIKNSDFFEGLDIPLEELEAVSITITQTVTIIYEEVTLLSSGGFDLGGLTSIEELSAAYEKLGFDPEQAHKKATNLALFSLALDSHIQNLRFAYGDGPVLGNGANIEASYQKFTIQSIETSRIFAQISASSSLSLRDVLQLPGGANPAGAAVAQAAGSGLFTQFDAEVGGAPVATNIGTIAEEGFFEGTTRLFSALAQELEALQNQFAPTEETAEVFAQNINKIGAFIERIAQQIAPNEAGFNLGQQSLLQSSANQSVGIRPDVASAASSAPTVSGQGVMPEIAEGVDPAVNVSANAAAAEEEKQQQTQNENTSSRVQKEAPQQSAAEPKTEPVFTRTTAQNIPNLLEPVQASYVVRPAAGGGVEVVDPQTGEVIQTNYTAQNSPNAQPRAENTLQAQQEAVYQQRVVKQVQVHVRTLASHGGGQIVVGLNPKELGRVQVRLEIANGQVNGAITVQRADVAEVIARDIRSLQAAFQDLGLEFNQEGISIQLENNAGQANQENAHEGTHTQNSGTRFASDNHTDVNDAQPNPEEGTWQNPDRLLDVRI